MVLRKQKNPYAKYFTPQEADMLKNAAALQHEADLLRVLIHRILAALSQEDEALSLGDQAKLYTLILRAVSALVSLQREVQPLDRCKIP
jgi:hypothetical protein